MFSKILLAMVAHYDVPYMPDERHNNIYAKQLNREPNDGGWQYVAGLGSQFAVVLCGWIAVRILYESISQL